MLLYPLFEKGIAVVPSVGIHFYLTLGEAQGFGYLDLTIGAPAIDWARLIVVCSVDASWKEFGAVIFVNCLSSYWWLPQRSKIKEDMLRLRERVAVILKCRKRLLESCYRSLSS